MCCGEWPRTTSSKSTSASEHRACPRFGCVSNETRNVTMERLRDFELKALHAALDAQRIARALSWSQAAREINAQFDRTVVRLISPSTLAAIPNRRSIEGDGVLQM